MIVDETYRAAEILNSDMEQIQQWSDQWLVNLNQRKTEPMVISNKCINPHHPPIYMNDAIMREVEQHKHLGVIFQDDGCWNSHIDYIIDKATPRLNLMRKLKFKLSRELLQIIYFSCVRPILEYADNVWDNIPIYLRERLKTFNIEATQEQLNCVQKKSFMSKQAGKPCHVEELSIKLLNFMKCFMVARQNIHAI